VQPETKYARLGNDRIAYQVLGQGPPDLVMTGGYAHLDLVWEDPSSALFVRSLASFSRLILFDQRGIGASDPLPHDRLPPWESHAEELVAVLDAVGSARAAILAGIDGGPLALFFAGTRPERTSALILANTTAKFVAADDYRIGIPAEVAEAMFAQLDQGRGTDILLEVVLPSRVGDERFRRWYAKTQRANSPKASQSWLRSMFAADVRTVLPLIQAPTLVLHRRDFSSCRSSTPATWSSASAARSWSSCPAPTWRSSGRSRSWPSTSSSSS
jgi:pimeloyl-ACP methyl ester carboxylesterase